MIHVLLWDLKRPNRATIVANINGDDLLINELYGWLEGIMRIVYVEKWSELWWVDNREILNPDGNVIPWSQFKEVFFREYYPKTTQLRRNRSSPIWHRVDVLLTPMQENLWGWNGSHQSWWTQNWWWLEIHPGLGRKDSSYCGGHIPYHLWCCPKVS